MNMNPCVICLLAIWFINALLLLTVLFIVLKVNKNIKEKSELELMKFNFGMEPKETDLQLLDNLIQEKLAEYRIMKLENVDKLYITEKIQKEIFEYVLRKVMYQISPIYLQRLSYIYNKDRLDDIITQKINLHIIEYTIEVNGNIRR